MSDVGQISLVCNLKADWLYTFIMVIYLNEVLLIILFNLIRFFFYTDQKCRCNIFIFAANYVTF